MANTTYLHDRPDTAARRLRAALDTFFAGLGQGFGACLDARARMREFEALSARSDRQLAAMGLRRDQIARHVFCDMLYL